MNSTMFYFPSQPSVLAAHPKSKLKEGMFLVYVIQSYTKPKVTERERERRDIVGSIGRTCFSSNIRRKKRKVNDTYI
jgi:hypothetical protein